MDFVKALTYPFDDQDWLKKLGIILLVSFVGAITVIGMIPAMILLQGWSIETIKRVKGNHPTPLADWDDFGGMFSKGLWPFIASFVYQIPTVIFVCLAVVANTAILPLLGSDDSAGAGAMGMTGIWVCCSCVIVLYAIAAGVVLAGGLIRYIDKPDFGTFMQFGENLALVRNNIGDFGMALLFIIIGFVIAMLVSFTGIGGLVAGPFMAYFSSHILGQLAQKLSSVSVPQV